MTWKTSWQRSRRRGVGGTLVNFCLVCAAGISEPLPRLWLFCGQLYTPSLSLLGKFVIFAIPILSHYLFSRTDPFFRLNEEHFTFHLQYKHFGTFANRKCEELCNPKKSENVRPHSWLLKKIRPHCSQSSRENATPSSDTSPLAYYKEVRPLPQGITVSKKLILDSMLLFPH